MSDNMLDIFFVVVSLDLVKEPITACKLCNVQNL